jgi:hypothetical protein
VDGTSNGLRSHEDAASYTGDPRLQRDVAIKVLPDSVAADPDRMARFEQEARALAALNHPNIAAIYAVEARALVMELVEGEDLSDLIARGAVVTKPTFSASTPRIVGRLRFPLSAEGSVSASPDLSRLLAAVPEQSEGARSITVVLNRAEALNRGR